ncbi:MAG: DUF6510 family protein [Hyphomicrobiaceae bacterium]
MSTDLQATSTAPLDGNAAAGIMREVFAFDVTTARVTCSGCAAVGQIGETRVFGGTMGFVFRCARCDGVVLRVVRTPAGVWLDMQGALSLLVQSP